MRPSAEVVVAPVTNIFPSLLITYINIFIFFIYLFTVHLSEVAEYFLIDEWGLGGDTHSSHVIRRSCRS